MSRDDWKWASWWTYSIPKTALITFRMRQVIVLLNAIKAFPKRLSLGTQERIFCPFLLMCSTHAGFQTAPSAWTLEAALDR